MWKTVKLCEVLSIVRGGSPRPIEAYLTDDEDGINWIKISDATSSNRYIYKTKEKIRKEGEKKSRLVKSGDFLLSNSMSFGRPYIMRTTGCVHDGWLVLSDYQETLDPEFLYYLLSSKIVKSQFESSARGSTVRNLNIDLVSSVVVSFPPLAEQQRIVEKLDRAFEEIDRAIEATEESIKKTKSLIDKSLNELTSASGKEVYLSDVCSIESKLVDPKEEPFKSQYHIGAGNILSMSNDVQEIKTAEEEGLISGKFPFNKNHVLYSKIRPYLRKVHLPSFEGICSADIYPLVPDDQLLEREFLFYLLLSERFTDYAMKGSARAGMPKVNREHLFKFKFNLPFIDEQVKLSRVTSKVFDEANNLGAIFMEKISLIAKVKSAILAQELKGPE